VLAARYFVRKLRRCRVSSLMLLDHACQAAPGNLPRRCSECDSAWPCQ